MRTLIRLIVFAACTVAVAATLGPIAVQAMATVGLPEFRGQQDGNSVLLEWATATELDTADSYVERASQEGGPFQELSQIGLVPSEAPPDSLFDAEYKRRDQDNVILGRSNWYMLVEVETSQGNESRTNPIEVKVGPDKIGQTATPTTAATQDQTQIATRQTVYSTAGATPPPTALPEWATGPTVTTAQIVRTAVVSAATSRNSYNSIAVVDASSAAISKQDNNSPKFQNQTTPVGTAYPGPLLDEPADPPQDGYPAPPPTPIVFPTESNSTAPEPGPEPGDVINGTPYPIIGSQNAGPPGSESAEVQEPQTEPFLGTVFLWLGFGAAFAVFISCVVGAIYYYDRKRAGSK